MLTPPQQDRLQSLHAYEWADDDAAISAGNLATIFDDIETTEELWYASFIVPWDPDEGAFDRILDHQLCDRGIALFLYWSLDPIAFHASGDLPLHTTGQLIARIEDSFRDGEYGMERIAYSPAQSPNYSDDHVGVPIPMLAPSTGIAVEFDYSTAVFGAQPNSG